MYLYISSSRETICKCTISFKKVLLSKMVEISNLIPICEEMMKQDADDNVRSQECIDKDEVAVVFT